MDDKTEIKKTDQEIEKSETEYAEEWERLEKLEEGGESGKADDSSANADASTDGGDGDDENPEKNGEDGDASGKSEHHGSVESLEKALNDTKGYAHRLESQNKELQQKLADFERGKATQQELDDAKKKRQDAKRELDDARNAVYEDYPELKALIDPILQQNDELQETLEELKKSKGGAKEELDADRQKAIEHFEKNIKPEVVKEHADFDQVINDQSYWEWAKKQRPALRTAAMDSPDPQDICWAIGEYKKSKASDAVQAQKSREEQARDSRIRNSQALRGGSTSSIPSSRKSHMDDYDAGWEEAGKLLEKEEKMFLR